jgi:hypothetical protein
MAADAVKMWTQMIERAAAWRFLHDGESAVGVGRL